MAELVSSACISQHRFRGLRRHLARQKEQSVIKEQEQTILSLRLKLAKSEHDLKELQQKLCQWEAWSGYLAFNEQYMLSMLCQDDSKPNVYSGSCGTDLSNEPRKSVQDRSCNAPPRRTCREPLVADNLPDISATAVSGYGACDGLGLSHTVLVEAGGSSEIPGDISAYRNWQPGSKNCIRQNSCTFNELENEAAVTLQHFWRKKVQLSIGMRVSSVGDNQSGERCAAPELCIAPALVRAVRQMRAAGEEAMTELSLTQWQHMQEALEDVLHGLREAGRSSRIKQEVEQGMHEVEEGVQFVKYRIHKYKNDLGMKQHPLASKSLLSAAASETQWDPMNHPVTGSANADREAPEHASEIYHGMATLLMAAADASLKRTAAGDVLSQPLDLGYLCEALMFKAELQSIYTDLGTISSDSSQRPGQDSSQQSGSRLKLQQLIEAAPQ